MRLSMGKTIRGMAVWGAFAALMQAGAIAAPPPVAEFKATLSPSSVKVGQTVTLKVVASIKSGYHIYSTVAVPPPGPKETSFEVVSSALKPSGKMGENAPHVTLDKNFGKKVGTHEKQAVFTQKFVVTKGAKSGKVAVAVTYMACGDKFCLPPDLVDLPALPLTIVK